MQTAGWPPHHGGPGSLILVRWSLIWRDLISACGNVCMGPSCPFPLVYPWIPIFMTILVPDSRIVMSVFLQINRVRHAPTYTIFVSRYENRKDQCPASPCKSISKETRSHPKSNPHFRDIKLGETLQNTRYMVSNSFNGNPSTQTDLES